MNKKLTTILLAVLLIIIGKVDAATLTQKIGEGYIRSTVVEGQEVTVRFVSNKYTFSSWTVESGNVSIDTTNPVVTFTMPSSNVIIKANYEGETSNYTISYNANGGNGAMPNQTVVQGSSVTLNSNTFTYSGYSFKGWSTSTSGSVVYTNGASVTPTANMTLYAVWEVATPATLAENSTWYKGTTAKNTITEINIVDSYTTTGSETESWTADDDGSGDIMCYVEGTTLTIAGNGTGSIFANADSSRMFSGSSGSTRFTSVTSISGMDLLDTSKVTNMYEMFGFCSALTELDVSNFDTSAVINMMDVFRDCKVLTSLDVSKFNTSAVTNMSWMFYNCKALTSLDLSNFDTSKVTDMNSMFYECKALTSLDVSSFDTSQVTDMSAMFYNCRALTSLNVSNFNTSKVTDMSHMFYWCLVLTSLDVSSFDTSKVTDMSWMFYCCRALTSLDVSSFDTSKVTDMSHMFYGLYLTSLDVSSFDTSSNTTTSNMFMELKYLEQITLGANFSFSSTATTCILPTPSSTYIDGADGKWYTSDGTGYAPADVPSNTAATYYASPDILSSLLVNNVSVGDYITYTPSSTMYEVSINMSGASSYPQYNPSNHTSWRIFSVSGDTVEIISARSIGTLTLQGSTGYINAVQTYRN